ncbi:MAG TPA: sensor domain-containing diguanylate cyclase [Rhodocyclaceae bacterium]|nr:sensor domain-containing diguanylate cyclase [Rhodocyclaceae bacterium]
MNPSAAPASAAPADREPVRYGIRFLLAVSATLLTAVTAGLTAYAYLALDHLQARMEGLAQGNLVEISLARRLHDSTEALLRPINLMAELPGEAPTTATVNAVGMQLRDVRANADALSARLADFGSDTDQERMAKALAALQNTEQAVQDFTRAAGRRAVAEGRRTELTRRIDHLFDQHFENATRVENLMRTLVSRAMSAELPEAAQQGRLQTRLDSFLDREMIWLAVAQDLRTDARELLSLVRNLAQENDPARLPMAQRNVEIYANRLLAWHRLPEEDGVRSLGRVTDSLVAALTTSPSLAQLRGEEISAESAVAASAKRAAAAAAAFSILMQEVVHELGQDVRAGIRRTRSEVQRAQTMLTAAATLAAIIGILLVYVVVTRRVIHPLERITHVMRRAAADLSAGKPGWQTGLIPASPADNDEVAAMSRALGVFRDMLTQREEDLSRSEAQLRTILVTINEAIQLWDRAGLLVYANNAATHLFGVPVGRFYNQVPGYWQFLHDDGTAFTTDDFPHILALRTGVGQTGVIMQVVNPSGISHWLLINAQPVTDDDDGEVLGVVSSCSDISEFKLHQSQLEYLAHHDPLTNLPNRTLLEDRLEHAIFNADRHGTLLAVCYLDLDGFKPVNDQYGHAAGDTLLREVSQRLKARLRGGDTVARLGGDEFVLLLCELGDVEECQHTLERVLESISMPCTLGTDPQLCAYVTASIGVTVYPTDKADSNALLRHADYAMYLAKQAGKNAFRLFQPNSPKPPAAEARH